MASYSIQQLLEWTSRDHLIDTYSIGADGSYRILIDGYEYVLSDDEARQMLVGLLRDSASRTFGNQNGDSPKA